MGTATTTKLPVVSKRENFIPRNVLKIWINYNRDKAAICNRIGEEEKVLGLQHYIGFFITLAVAAAIGLYACRFVKTAADFSTGGGKLTSLLVTGYLVGAFVGGTSTVGTAQVAYRYGISGLWFTLGAGLGCLLMACLLVKPMRRAKVDTIPQFLGCHFGAEATTWSVLYTTGGMFIQIIAQVLAAIPLMMSLLPVGTLEAALLTVLLIITYIFLGGIWGSSLVGIFKTLLIYISMGVAGVYCLRLAGGLTGLQQGLPSFPWFSLFPSGISKELAACFSVVVGFISTQTYMQAVFAGKDSRAARKGILLSAVLIPLVGAACVTIGMYMRLAYPNINPAQALPMFAVLHLQPIFSGVMLATLLISLITVGSSLTLGVCTMLSQDIYKKIFRPKAADKELLMAARLLVLLVTTGALVVVLNNKNSLVLQWAFLSMALRGVTVFLPLLAAVFLPGKFNAKTGATAILVAPGLAVIWSWLGLAPVEPLYVGLGISLLIFLSGVSLGTWKKIYKVKRRSN